MDLTLARIQHGAWERPNRLPITEWARQQIILPDAYAKSGPVDLRPSPWLIPPLEALMDHHVQKVNSLKGLQTGGSLVGEIYALYRIVEYPAPIMWNFQTEAIRDKAWRTRLGPLFRTAPCIKDIMPTDRQALSHDIISLPGCDVLIQGGGHNESNLQTLSIQVQINDEVWQWDPGLLYQAEGRTDAFGSAKKIYNISQGNERDSDWDVVFNEGVVHELVVRCPDCTKTHPLIWSQRLADGSWAGVVWENKKYLDGRPDIATAQATVHYRCPLCGHHHPANDAAMKKLISTCSYSTEYPSAAYHAMELPDRVVGNPPGVPYIKSYHWNSLVTVPLPELVKEWLTADAMHKLGDITLKKQFLQKKLAVYYTDTMTEQVAELQLSGYQMGEGYAGETDRLMSIDCQEGIGDDTPHFWVDVRGWIAGSGSSGLIWAGRVELEDDLVEMQRTHGVPAKYVVADGRNKTAQVAAMCGRHGWVMLMGDDRESFPHQIRKGRRKETVQKPFSKVQKYDVMKGKGPARYVNYLLWSNPTIKDMLHRVRHGNGVLWELPMDVPDWYRDQLDSEQRKKIRKGSRWGHRWEPKVRSNPNNHIWDCECMQFARALMAGLLPFDVSAYDEPAPEPTPAESKQLERKTKKDLQVDDRQLMMVVDD